MGDATIAISEIHWNDDIPVPQRVIEGGIFSCWSPKILFSEADGILPAWFCSNIGTCSKKLDISN
jgi:hypothetical protein